VTDPEAPAAGHPKTHAAVTSGGSAMRRYQDVIVGSRSFGRTLYFEWCAWLGPLPGALGLLMRRMFWPRLFGACGRGAAFGTGVLLRHPHRIHLGQRVVLGDGVLLDARTPERERVIELGDDVMVANGVMLQCKGGTLAIGPRTGIGVQTVIQSTSDCPVSVGADCIIGPQCYLVGGGSYHHERVDVPIWRQGIRPDGGCVVEDDVWLGAGVTVLGGVRMGSGSVAAAGAVVTRDVEARQVCAGVPARVVRARGEGS
jgi:galactoside O-acetyltransferase